MLLLLLASCQSSPQQAGSHAPPAPDPWVGSYTVFGAHADGFLEYSGVDGPTTIRKQGEAYTIDIEPGVLFYPDGSGGLVPRPGHQLIRYITIGYAGEQTALVVQQGFQTLYLLPGVGPAAWVDGDWFSASPGAADPWAYQRFVGAAYSRSERVRGELTLRGEPVHARPGDIIFTPHGKFMFFGEPSRRAYVSGWLNTTTYNHAVFNDDGSLTEEFQEARAALILARLQARDAARTPDPGTTHLEE